MLFLLICNKTNTKNGYQKCTSKLLIYISCMVMMLYYDLFSRHLGCLRNRVEMLFGQSIVLWTVLNCESIYIVMTGNIYIYIYSCLWSKCKIWISTNNYLWFSYWFGLRIKFKFLKIKLFNNICLLHFINLNKSLIVYKIKYHRRIQPTGI